MGYVSFALVAAVVEMVSVANPADVPVMVTGLVEPKLNVGWSCAPAGLDVTEAVSATLPVKPPVGVTVIVELFAVDAPGETVTMVPATMKLGLSGGTIVSLSVLEVLAEKAAAPW